MSENYGLGKKSKLHAPSLAKNSAGTPLMPHTKNPYFYTNH